jgi:hypothetical protein
MSLPVEMLLKIFSFCDDNIIISLKQSPSFSFLHKDLNSIMEMRSRIYWNKIYIDRIEYVMRPMMEEHMMNVYFGSLKYKLTPERLKFQEEWHMSDIEIYSTLLDRRIDNVISTIVREKERLKQKYNFSSDLDKRPFIFNRLLLVSLASIY